MKKLIIVLPILLLTSCASVISGRSQTISINTDPAGADCKLIRAGQILGTTKTPGSVYIEKTKDDMTVECKKPGYFANSVSNHSGSAGSVFGNILLGGLVGWAVDSASGADNEYDANVFMTLEKCPNKRQCY